MTRTWAKHFAYQVFAFVVSIAMIVGVVNYAFTKSYDERTLSFVDGFTITAHTGAFDTTDNTLASLQTAIDNNVQVFEIDVRQRPDGTLIMAHDIVVSNSDGVELSSAFEIVKNCDLLLNLDVKETRVLTSLHDMIVEYSLSDRVFLTGIEVSQVNLVQERCPDIDYYVNYIPSRFKIFSEDYQAKIIDMLDNTDAIGINCKYVYASRTLSNLLHKNGYKLSVFTVDRTYAMKRSLINKPDNITTYKPEKLQGIIDNWGK